MTGMHVREPRPCAPPLRGEHSTHIYPTTLFRWGEIKLIVEKREYAISDQGPYREYRENEAAPNKILRVTLESVSSCTRFSGILTISSFSFNRLS